MFRRRQSKFSRFWRIADVVCTILVLSYVLFDVLDLDGSDLAKFNHALPKASLQVYIPSELDLEFSSHKFEIVGLGVISLLALSTEVVRGKWVETSQFSLLRNARDHGYRPGLARNSLPDKSADH
jgi:hypothetical protein